MTPAAWLVRYGDRQQLVALFVDHARAQQFAVTHHGIVKALYEALPK